MKRVIVRYKDGTNCNLDADFISYSDGIVQIWKGTTELVAMFNIGDIAGACMTEIKQQGKKDNE